MLQGWILIHVTHNIYYKYEKNIKGKGHKRDYVTVLKIDDSSMRPLWSVSYTHLDVYKRQGETRGTWPPISLQKKPNSEKLKD